MPRLTGGFCTPPIFKMSEIKTGCCFVIIKMQNRLDDIVFETAWVWRFADFAGRTGSDRALDRAAEIICDGSTNWREPSILLQNAGNRDRRDIGAAHIDMRRKLITHPLWIHRVAGGATKPRLSVYS
jgi:hypothetical protein